MAKNQHADALAADGRKIVRAVNQLRETIGERWPAPLTNAFDWASGEGFRERPQAVIE